MLGGDEFTRVPSIAHIRAEVDGSRVAVLGQLFPLLLAGGGLPQGVVIGQSNSNGGESSSEPVKIPNLIGTIMHTLFDVGKLRVTRGVSREVLAMSDYAPIRGLNG